MGNAQAKYEIAAQDKTAAAWASAIGRASKGSLAIKGALSTAFAGLGVGALTSQISKAIEFGDEIGKIKAKANLTAEATQELVYAFRQFDIETPALTTALKKMNVTISEAATGGKEATEVFKALGIPLEQLQRLKSDERIELIADAISRLGKEEDRARALTTIFGKAGFDLAPAFENGAAGIRASRQEIQQMGRVLGEDQIAKLQDADDATKRLKQSWGAFAATLTSEVAPALTTVLDMLSGGWTKPTAVSEKLKELERLRENRESFGWINSDETNAELDRRIRILEREILGSGAHGSRPDKRSTQAPGFQPEPKKTGGKTFAEIQAEADKRINEEGRERWREWQQLGSDAAQGAADSIRETNEALDAMFDASAEAANRAIDKQQELSVFADQAARSMQQGWSDFFFDPMDKGFKGLVSGFANSVRRMLADAASAQLMEALFGKGGGGFLGSILGAAAGSYGGGKAEGGPLQSGKWYIAGERGPEPIWGGGAGAFAAGYGGGGGTVVNAPLYVDARGATQDAVKELIASMPLILKRHGEEVEGRIVEGIRRRRYPI